MNPRRVWKGSPPHLDIADDPRPILGELEPRRLAVLAGAGVSLEAPSGLPLASQFLQAFYETCLPRSCDRALFLSATSEVAPLLPVPRDLRFETVVGVVQHRFDRTLEILDIFGQGRPNRNHRSLERLARSGAIVMTTNFDTHIEEGGNGGSRVLVTEDDYRRPADRGRPGEVWHLHGAVTDPATIVASIRECWKSKELFRLDRSKGRALAEALAERDLLVVGYSGSDDYDIAPALEEARSDRMIVWVQHTPPQHGMVLADGVTPLVTEYLPDGTTWYRAPAAHSLAAMIGDGARRPDRVVLLRHDTARVLESLAALDRSPSSDGDAVDLESHFVQWRQKHLGDEASRYLLAVLLCHAGGPAEERRRLLQEFQQDVVPRLSSAPPGTVDFAAYAELTLMGAEAGLVDLGSLQRLPPVQELLRGQPALKSGFLTAQGRVALGQGLVDEAISAFTESLRVRHADGYLADVEVTQYELAHALFMQGYPSGDLADAEAEAEESLESARAVAHPEAIARSALLLGRINERLEEVGTAVECYEMARDAAFRAGLESLSAECSGELGMCLWINGATEADWERSAEALGEAFRVHDRKREWGALKTVSSHLALCHEALGHLAQSVLADCVAYKCARAVGESETAAVAAQRIRKNAPRVLAGRSHSSDVDAFVAAVHQALVDDGFAL